MTDDNTTIPTSLSLKIGLGVFDGGSTEWLAKTHSVSIPQIERSWMQCREWLSKHFAAEDNRDYALMDEAALRERLEDSLRMLIDWRSQELQNERVADWSSKPDDELVDENV